MKGAEAYVDASKDTWRGWKWNAIARGCVNFNDRISPAEKARRLSEKTVLYLVGPEDHDRQKAMAKGFANHNLIAIDLEQERVDAVRRDGGLAICGSLQQVVMNWPADWPIDVIDADLCHGMVKDSLKLQECFVFCEGLRRSSVVSVNLLRGRDARSNPLRQSVGRLPEDVVEFCSPHASKHRGANWLVSLVHTMAVVTGNVSERFPGTTNHTVQYAIHEDFFRQCNELWYPQTNSYRSKTSGQWFDSVVHRWAWRFPEGQEALARDGRAEVSESLSDVCSDSEGVKARIAALRAVRTMKMRAGY